MSDRPGSPHRSASWVGAWSGRRAALTPERIGLVDATTGTEFTYADLETRANRTARLLRAHGVSAHDGENVGGRVAVISRNRPAFVDLFFATGKTGGVLAPLSHRLAPPELCTLLNVVDPELLVVEAPFVETVSTIFERDDRQFDCPVYTLGADAGGRWDTFEEALPADGSDVETAALSMDDTHLFLHTGGSTGTPKETVVTHRSIYWNSVNTITAWGLREGDLTPVTFPMFHTGGWNVITVPLWHVGGTVVIAREFDPAAVLSVVDDRAADVLVAVPAVLRAMADHDRWSSTDLSSIRLVKSGGGPCRERVMRAWWDRDVDLSQGYGLTECGPNNFAMPTGWPREKADSVGIPTMHVETRIVDPAGNPVEDGEIGELELAGPHAADGYWNEPEETAATFGDGWVSTGDLARVDEDGYYYIEGRATDMFVSGGENVYPAAVEDAIAAHPAVAEVVVVPIDDEQWGQVGKAVVQLTPDATQTALDVETLRNFLDDRLARYKHPRELAFVESMPTSGPSKLDRQAIESTYGDRQDL